MRIKNLLTFFAGVIIGFVGSYKVSNYIHELQLAEDENLNNGEGIEDEYRDKNTKYFEYKENDRTSSDGNRESSDEHESIPDEYRLAKEEVYDSVDDASVDVEGDSILQVVDQLNYAFDRFADCVALGQFKLLPYDDEIVVGYISIYYDQTSDPNLFHLRFDGQNWYWQNCYPGYLWLSEDLRDGLSNSSVEGLMMAVENMDENRKWAVAEYNDNYGCTVHAIIERGNDI